mmetsp:Transcript_92419/g.198120  ORF Transcript_92419/g.198120 Transcript_92419/m.198120 type:complete len:178 (-) Transcript_92419:208-741(-)
MARASHCMRSSARGTRLLVLAAAILLAFCIFHPQAAFLPSPATLPKPAQNVGSLGAGLMGALGTLLTPSASFAADAKKPAAPTDPVSQAIASVTGAAESAGNLLAKTPDMIANSPNFFYKLFFQDNLYAFGVPWLSWNLVWWVEGFFFPVAIFGGVFLISFFLEDKSQRPVAKPSKD